MPQDADPRTLKDLLDYIRSTRRLMSPFISRSTGQRIQKGGWDPKIVCADCYERAAALCRAEPSIHLLPKRGTDPEADLNNLERWCLAEQRRMASRPPKAARSDLTDEDMQRLWDKHDRSAAVPLMAVTHGGNAPHPGAIVAESGARKPGLVPAEAYTKAGQNADAKPDDGEPFYKPKYFQKWNIGNELLRRNATIGKKYTKGRVRRIKKRPSSGKGERAVYWYSEPDAHRRWPDRFKVAEDERNRKDSKVTKP